MRRPVHFDCFGQFGLVWDSIFVGLMFLHEWFQHWYASNSCRWAHLAWSTRTKSNLISVEEYFHASTIQWRAWTYKWFLSFGNQNSKKGWYCTNKRQHGHKVNVFHSRSSSTNMWRLFVFQPNLMHHQGKHVTSLDGEKWTKILSTWTPLT